MSRVPEELEKQVVEKLYRDADAMNWRHRGQTDHNRQYANWLDEPGVGGILTSFMSREDARLWIKDGPMKEYRRALAGIGRYAELTATRLSRPREVIGAVFGDGWELVQGTLGIKPLHCMVRRGDEDRWLFWGPAKDFKHLLWASLTNTVRRPNVRSEVAVVESAAEPGRTAARRERTLIAERCRLVVHHVRPA